MEEIWKDIKEYEGYYQVSNQGNVRSLDRLDNNGRRLRGRVLKHKKDGGGYHQVCLSKDGIHKDAKIHRLVCEAFLPNPLNKPTVNHKDENIDNNALDNLEWATYKENANYGTRLERCYKNRDYKKIGKNIQQSLYKNGFVKSIIQLDGDMNIVKRWRSITEAAHTLGILSTGIGNVLKGRCATYKGYIWRYDNA